MFKFIAAVAVVTAALCWYDPANQETRAYWEYRLFPSSAAHQSALPVDDTAPREIAAVDNRLTWLKEGDLK
jgi:hypothetical protein